MLLQFKIQIEGITKPPVWRRVLVPGSFTFDKLHRVIQEAFGWEYEHLYMFTPKGYGSTPLISVPSKDDWEKPDKNALTTKLYSVLSNKGQTFTYIYDFGDDWLHKITLEDTIDRNEMYASCIDGKGACPPEDCGGCYGYEDMKSTMEKPYSKRAKEIREWLGISISKWNPEKFDLQKANERVMSV